MYVQVADQLAVVPYMKPFQRDVLEKALRFYQDFAKRKSNDSVIRLETAHALFRVGGAQRMLGHRRQGDQTCREALAAVEELAAELPSDPRRQMILGEAKSDLAHSLTRAGRRQEAEDSFREVVAL